MNPKSPRSYAPLVLFLAAYLSYVLVTFMSGGEGGLIYQFLALGFIGLMMLAAIWKSKGEDEVKRAIMNETYEIAFWVTLLFLLSISLFDTWAGAFGSLLPIWAVPVLSWLAGYGVVNLRYR